MEARPDPKAQLTADRYLTAVADAGAHGGRWIISLDDALAGRLAANDPAALVTWKRVTTAARFFEEHKDWAGYTPVSVVAVVSDFTGKNEGFSQELLNLLARAGQHYRIVRKEVAGASSFAGLKAVIYADAEAPLPELRKQVMAFVDAGGMLITVPNWGTVPATPMPNDEHPRYSWRSAGKGRIAVAKAEPDDPWLMANDSVVLVSHRYDLVRFWNGGSTVSYFTEAPDRKRAIVHLLFYANRGPDSASVQFAGRYRTARAATVNASVNVEVKPRRNAVEIHLPLVDQYVAVELGD